MITDISQSYNKGTSLQKNYGKMTGSFSYNCFVKFMVRKFWSYNMTMLYLNLCFNEMCYEGTALYF